MRVACIIPAHDEAAILEANAKRVWAWGRSAFGETFALVLSENGSHDSTAWVAKLLEKILPGTVAISSKTAGKGGAIKRAAATVEADAYLFMDADLSADLASAARLVRAVAAGTDCVVGSRRTNGAEVRRPLSRRLITWAYAQCTQALLRLGVRDAQCGCKAFSRHVRDEVLPTVRDNGFFFDTEFLARLRQKGARLEEFGIRWSERPRASGASKVNVFLTGLEFLKKAAALRKELR